MTRRQQSDQYDYERDEQFWLFSFLEPKNRQTQIRPKGQGFVLTIYSLKGILQRLTFQVPGPQEGPAALKSRTR